MTQPMENGAAQRDTAERRAPSDKDQLDKQLDEALEETFPASDSIAVTPLRK